MNYDRGIRGGDFLDEGVTRIVSSRVACDNPVRSASFYGFRTFRSFRIPTRLL